MMRPLHSVALKNERDVVNARQRGRSIAAELGFDHHDQIRIATAVSEIARNAFRYAREGAVSFLVDSEKQMFLVRVVDHGSGIPHLELVLGGSYRSTSGMGMGILGTKRLMDEFSIESTPLGTSVELGKCLPAQSEAHSEEGLRRVALEVARQNPAAPIDELQTQNRELLRTLNELRERKEDLDRINAELQDTNRGVVALYAELDERADYLRRASELKSSFLSNMSHEFRTPLNSMLALTRMLLDRLDGELTVEQEQQIKFIQRSAKELAEMVDDLLDLAKVEAGRLDVKPRRFSVADLFGALRGMLRPLLAESTLHLAFEAERDLPELFTDEQKVSQVLRNFISNAIKFTPQGMVSVSAVLLGADVEFAVTDTGIGIPEGDREVIFEEFTQIDSSLQKRVKGTGLGLPLTRKLAALLGGTVQMESAVGTGSTFRLRVPVIYAGEAGVDEAAPPADASRRLIVTVEDNPETAFLYARYLAEAGFQAYNVTSVDAARKLFELRRPAAIILDLHLGAETTWDLLRELKSGEDGVPVLVMSVSDEQRRAYAAGADAYLTKPFMPKQMLDEVHRLLRSASRPRILMIDDNEVARYLLRSHIDERRFEVLEARDGREGIRGAAECKPDLVFLDFYMPGLTGAEVLRNLRHTDGLAHIPIVLHSTKVLDAEEAAFLAEHGVTVFPKQSLTLSDPARRVERVLECLLQRPSGSGNADA